MAIQSIECLNFMLKMSFPAGITFSEITRLLKFLLYPNMRSVIRNCLSVHENLLASERPMLIVSARTPEAAREEIKPK